MQESQIKYKNLDLQNNKLIVETESLNKTVAQLRVNLKLIEAEKYKSEHHLMNQKTKSDKDIIALMTENMILKIEKEEKSPKYCEKKVKSFIICRNFTK